jgi:hypothetical protein
LVWPGEFLSKFLFLTDPKPKFVWRVFGGPRFPKTIHVLGDPKVIYKIFAMPLGLCKLGNAAGVVQFLNLYKNYEEDGKGNSDEEPDYEDDSDVDDYLQVREPESIMRK